jgi:hypothetical protein
MTARNSRNAKTTAKIKKQQECQTQQNACNSILKPCSNSMQGGHYSRDITYLIGMPAVAMSRAASPLESVGQSNKEGGRYIYAELNTLMAVHYSCPSHALLALHIGGALKRIQKKYTGHVLFIFFINKSSWSLLYYFLQCTLYKVVQCTYPQLNSSTVSMQITSTLRAE